MRLKHASRTGWSRNPLVSRSYPWRTREERMVTCLLDWDNDLHRQATEDGVEIPDIHKGPSIVRSEDAGR